jgi:hypothetical protein
MGAMLAGRVQRGPVRLVPSVARTGAATAALAVPVWLVAHAVTSWEGRVGTAAAVVLSSVTGVAAYWAVSRLLGAPELALLAGVRRRALPQGGPS